jgi:DNA-binding GntR family transcriptional regulator
MGEMGSRRPPTETAIKIDVMAKATPDSLLPLTRASAVASELRRLIQGGEMEPGTRLRQTEIAERFGVSTTPVREAFMTLAREGLVRQDAHRGVVVFAPSTSELAEIYEMREVLEPLATKLAAKKIGDEELGELDEIVDQMRTASPEEYAALNRGFHAKIYQAADRPRLLDIIETLREAAASYLLLTVRQYDEKYRAQVQHEHEEIVRQLRSGTPAKAARATREHLEHNAAHVRTLISG